MAKTYDAMFNQERAITCVKDIEPAQFIKAFAGHMKRQGKFELPKWADVAKTGVHKELAPRDPDWLYTRAASIARKVYIRKGTGAGGLAKWYGGQKRRGTCKNIVVPASRKIIRYCMLQLEDMGILEKVDDGEGKGRVLTPEGQREMDTVAVQAASEEGEEESDEE